MALDSAIGRDEFISDLDGMYALIYRKFPSQEGEDVWGEP